MGVGGVTPGKFSTLDAKLGIFLHSECICSTEVLFTNLDETGIRGVTPENFRNLNAKWSTIVCNIGAERQKF